MKEISATTADGRSTTLDTCGRCEGLWIDRDEIEVVAPELGSVGESARVLERAVRRGTGIPACPRCFLAPLEIALLGVDVDHCTGCGGLWLDGDEHEGFAREADRARGLPAPEPARGGAYRTAAKAARVGVVDCAFCKQEVVLAQSYMSSDGAICAACHAARSIKQTELELREQVTIGDPSRSAGDAVFGRGPPPPAPEHAPPFGPNVYARGFLVLLEVLSAASRCPRCGCSRASRCGHSF